LEPAEDIRVGVWRRDGQLATIPLQPLEDEEESEDGTAAGPAQQPLQIDVHLGKRVWLQRGTQVKVQLGGDLNIRTDRRQKIQGKIELAGGVLDVQGKRFEIERGTVTFENEDPSNPNILATARWDAPGYSVYAEYLGTAQEGKLTLRSEPPLTEDEILSLIMFGAPDGAFGSGQGDQGNAAAAFGVVGGTAAKGLNRALSSVTNLDVSARVDTSSGSARPELMVQLSPRVSARVTRAIGEPSAGTSPDRTFLTLDFRIRRAWSLSTQVGDRGASALDLIWRHRY
jgi:translocation and assembly module TamB